MKTAVFLSTFRMLLLSGVLSLCGAAHASGVADQPLEKVLDDLVSQQAKGFRALSNTRGIKLRHDPQAFSRLGRIGYRLDARLLVLSRQGVDIRSSLIGFGPSGGHLLATTLLGSAWDISEQLKSLRLAMRVDEAQVSRSPRFLRGVQRIPSAHGVAMLDWRELARALGKRMFPAELSEYMRDARHLMISPTGNLGDLPFALLVPEGWNEPLSQRLSLSIMPSLVGEEIDEYSWRGTAGDSILLFGNPDLSRHRDWDFPDLPGARSEAEAVLKRVPGTGYFGTEASSEKLMKHPEATMLYFATHAVADSDHALDKSFIALSDILLTPREIQHFHFKNTALAVLSACQTSLGAAHDGGTIGLARAFHIAGVPGVVSSLWSVDDEATRQLMGLFLDKLASAPPQEALAQAMRAMHATHQDPVKWASFVYFGVPMLHGQINVRQ